VAHCSSEENSASLWLMPSRHENHCTRRHPLARIVTGTGNDVSCGVSGDSCTIAHTAHAGGIEVHWRLIEDFLDLDVDTKDAANLGGRGTPLLLHRIQCVGLRMP
jgi:hypothetical protein